MNTRKLLVLVLMLVSVLFSACAPAATPAPTAIPATTVPPTMAPTVTPAQTLTTFSSKIYKLHMSVSFGADWHILDDYTDLVTVASKQKDWELGFNIVTDAKLVDPINGNQIPFPEDFAAWVKSNPNFKTDETTEVTVAGIKGLQIVATVTATKQIGFLYLSGTNWNMLPSEMWRFILLNDVNGERVLITLVAAPDQFKDFVQQSQSILDSVVFSKPTTFTSKTFKLPMTFSYGPDWSVAEDVDQIYLKNKLRASGWELAFILVADAKIADPNSAATIPWPQDFVAYLKSNPYIEAGEPKPITFGGFKGIQIDAHAKYTGDKRTFIDLAGSDWLYLDMEEMWRFIVLDDVNEERLLITMIVNPPLDELQMFADAAQKVLDTVVFSTP